MDAQLREDSPGVYRQLLGIDSGHYRICGRALRETGQNLYRQFVQDQHAQTPVFCLAKIEAAVRHVNIKPAQPEKFAAAHARERGQRQGRPHPFGGGVECGFQFQRREISRAAFRYAREFRALGDVFMEQFPFNSKFQRVLKGCYFLLNRSRRDGFSAGGYEILNRFPGDILRANRKICPEGREDAFQSFERRGTQARFLVALVRT